MLPDKKKLKKIKTLLLAFFLTTYKMKQKMTKKMLIFCNQVEKIIKKKTKITRIIKKC